MTCFPMAKWLTAVSVLTLAGLPLRAQQPLIRDISLNEANTPVAVNTFLQDRRGYLWLGTSDGLFRYNGENFTLVTGTANRKITALQCRRDSLWVGFKNGTAGICINGNYRNLRAGFPNQAAAIHQISNDRQNDLLWFSTSSGVTSWQADSIRRYDRHSGLSDDYIYTACPTGSRRLIVGTDHGINDLEWENGDLQVTVLTTEDGLPDNIVRVLTHIPGTALYWIGMQQGGIALYDTREKKVINFPTIRHWPYGQVNDILALSPESAWIATQKGYLLSVRLDDHQTLSIRPYFYPKKKFNQLLAGKSGNIWVATDHGLSILTARFLEYIPLHKPYQLGAVTAMAFDADNNLWLAQGRNLYLLRKNNGRHTLLRIHQANAVISCLYCDPQNRLWVGTMGNGLWYQEPNGKWISCQRPASLKTSNILSITGTKNRLWVATLTGVDELVAPPDGEDRLRLVRHHDKQSGIGSDYVYFLFPDHQGNIWMATDGAGICKYNGSQYSHYNQPTSADNVVYSITEDIHGSIWMAAYYKGLYHFRPDNPTRMIQEAVTDANISLVTTNASGQIVAVYEGCIDIWYPNSGQFRHINYRMGVDSTSQILNCMARDSLGNVYIPFEDGLLIFKNQKAFDIRANVHITSVSATTGDHVPDTPEFHYDENYITVRYEGINFTNPERLRYRYRLEGYDRDWITTKDAFVTFPNLPPGDYVFQVQASLNNNFGSAPVAQYTFHILAPLWQKPWFIGFVLLAIGSLIYILIRRKNKKRQQVVRLQQERMTFEYEYLKSQVNPHFLFNSLNTLTALIEDDSNAAVEYTERLSDLYKNMISFRNRDLIPLQMEWEILENYLFIQKGRFGAALQVRATLSGQLMHTRKIIPMALQMLVENAIKHNIVSRTQPLIIYIQSNQEDIIVTNPLNPTFHKEKGAGLALINIRKRYELLTNRPVIFGRYGNDYVVKIPLL